MSKKKSKQKKISIEVKSKTLFPLEVIEKNKYLPYLIFFLIAMLYFLPLIFGNNSMISTDGGIHGVGDSGGGLQYFKNPFKEEKVWSPNLGGIPISVSLIEYNAFLIRDILKIFFYDFRAHNILVMLLSVFAAASMYAFLRGMEINRLISIVLGIAYQFSPHFMSFTYSGHFSKMGIIAVLPLLFHFLNKGITTGKIKYFVWFGFFIGIDIFFAHLQLVHFSLLASGFYFIFRLITEFIKNKDFGWLSKRAGFYIIAVILGLGMGARGFAPQLQHNRTVSKRAGAAGEGLSKEYASSWALNAEEIASLVVPEFVNYDSGRDHNFYWGKNVFKINADYFGGIIFILSIIALLFFKKDHDIKFFFCLFLLGIFFALGSKSPVFNLMFHTVPGIKSFRAPSLMIFITAFSGFALSGIFLQKLFSKYSEKIIKISSYVFISLGVLFLLFTVDPNIILSPWKSIFYPDLSVNKLAIFNNNISELSKGFLLSSVFLIITGIGLLYYYRKKIRMEYLLIALIPVFIIDFWRIDKDFLKYGKVESGVTKKEVKIPAYEFIKNNDDSLFRVMPFHIPNITANFQNKFNYEGINFITGFNDFVLRRYDRMMKGLQNNREILSFINLANCKYLVFGQKAEAPFLNEIYKDTKNNMYVYRNKLALPWFYIRNKAVIEKDEEKVFRMILDNKVNLFETVILEEDIPQIYKEFLSGSSNKIAYDIKLINYNIFAGDVELNITLDKPGFLVISDNYHPKWKCFVNGEMKKIYRANYLFKGVFLDAGEHNIRFEFRTNIIGVSRTIMFLSMIILIAAGVFFTVKDV